MAPDKLKAMISEMGDECVLNERARIGLSGDEPR